VGVPLLIAVAVIAVIGSQRGWWKHQQRVIRRAAPARRVQSSHRAALALARSDAGFDEERFLGRVRRAFERAQSAWCEQQLEPLRAFVSDGVFERFSLQIQEQIADGWRQSMPELKLGALVLVEARSGRHFDSLTVRIPFSAKILRVERESGKELKGTRLPRESFSECWTFLRRSGAKSLTGEGLMEGVCPSCGAALAINQSARCSHCQSLVRSGQFDWVLTEITQASEWKPEAEAEVPGAASYLERDEGFNLPMLEDRASVAFWRKIAADRAGSSKPLTRLADDELCRRLESEYAVSGRSFLADAAVGSVRTLAVLPGEKRDRFVVEIVWDGRRAQQQNGELDLARQRSLCRHWFVFAREAGKSTELERAFANATCRTCGASDPGGTQSTCAYCDAPRSGDRASWTLIDVTTRHAGSGARLAAEMDGLDLPVAPAAAAQAGESAPLARESDAELLHWAATVARADGVISSREERALLTLSDRLGISRARVDELLAKTQHGLGPEPKSPEEARAWYSSLTLVALADGILTKDERGFLAHAASRLGMSRRQANQALGEARKELYRESRGARRAERQQG